MSQLETEIILNAPPEKVWKVLTDLDRYADWNPFIVSSTGVPAVGQRITNEMILNGKTNVFKPVVTKFEPPHEFEWLGSGMLGMFKGRHYFILEALGGGQTQLIHGEKFSGLLSGLVLKMIGDETRRQFQQMNKALQEELERQK